MNRKVLAPAPTSVTNVAQATLRSHSRASHGGSGTYTEMRAQIRKEREHEKMQQQRQYVSSIPASHREGDLQSRRQAQSNSHSGHLTSSLSDQKISQFSTSEDERVDEVSTDKKGYPRVLPPSSFAMCSDNVSNMSTASSQISSSSSTGIVRKRSQTASAQEVQHTSRQQHLQQNHSSHSSHGMQQLQQQQQHIHDRQESSFAARSDLLPLIQSPIEPPEQTIGIDTLQAAFSAKYYELANKCKNWEKYAAKLRAQLGVLEAENRVLKEQNSQLESDNAQLQAVLHQEEKTRTQLEGRMSSLEECLTQRSHSGGNLGAQYRAVEVLDYDHLSVPSAPSSAEKSSEDIVAMRHTPYCSTNLQVEDRSELRPPPIPSLPNGIGITQTTSVCHHNAEAEAVRNPNASSREISFETAHSKWEGMHAFDALRSPQLIQSTSDTATNVEGRSSRLGNRSDVTDRHVANQRSGTVGALGMVVPRSSSVLRGHRGHALTSQALAQQDAIEAIARPASAQRFNGTYLESNVSTTAASIVASTGVTKAALQSKRRSTVSGDRGPSLSLAQIVKGALTASGVVAAPTSHSQSRQTSPNDKAATSSDYLQECVEKRREAMRSSFNAQQKGMTPGNGHTVPSRPASRAASRISTQSGTRSRSRAGSVHDAIPVAVEDIFCNPHTVKAHSTETSPELLTEQLAVTGLDDVAAASQRLMTATDTQAVRLMTRKELSAVSSPSSLMATSPAKDQEEHVSFERKLYIRFQEELNSEEFQKFERCIQRYDYLDIPLEGNKGLITRVKRLLLVSDPDLRSKPEKLRVRQQLARDFEKMAKNFGQAQSGSQPQSAAQQS
ncbi:uncharacterized protein MEPE_01454 [Melanopsichium pennsylvanicum]|uniref:Uncharacterized protein n=2 Tax=Melanopsichium pennsylvanicum TaxID=63383 RepID=A0AAJ4XKF9_9BASI|nr:hypothetical protein BN887_03195 [Melanopsichium pennsylvanicum 4]SNX82748.1 uncharacterized protein MEPE_01454 [Melanopsichium pennsylvanicum]